MSTTTRVRQAGSVSRMLSKRGIPVGYKHTDFGYVDRDGNSVIEPGVMVTRNKVARYGGFEDYGCVKVFLVHGSGTGIPEDPEFQDRVEAALREARLPYRRDGRDFAVEDESAESPKVDEGAERLAIATRMRLIADQVASGALDHHTVAAALDGIEATTLPEASTEN